MIHSKPHQLTKLNMTHTLLLYATHTLLLLLLLSFSAAATVESTFPPDAVSLLAFKSHADLDHRLFYLLTEPFDYCQWQGVKCAQGRVVRLAVPGLALRGSLAPDSLSRLDQLRVLTLSNNSLSGPIPDLSPLQNLKYLFLSHNHFSGSFPPSLLSLHRLAILDLARNGLSGPIPDQLNALDRLTSLRLEFNRFNGSLPSLNHSLLSAFNVSGNNLSGPIPITPTLSRFGPTSFSLNSALCGEVLNRPCDSPASPFFDSSAAGPAGPQQSSPLVQTSESSESVVLSPNSPAKNHNKTGLIVGFVIAVAMLVAITLAASVAIRRRRGTGPKQAMVVHTPAAERELQRVTEGVVETKAKVVEEVRSVPKSGNLVFATGEAPLYGLEQLMRASAELLGRGTVGTTYKAVLDNQLVLTVKRLDAGKTAVTGSEAFGRHMDAVGGLRHPNLVPVRAYFQAKGERLVLFDYQPNGSLFNLIHGSRSTRAKPLHWTSCLKIAEDVAQGLAYIHNASKLTHGNLKSSNVLLGSDFEACLTDYGLAALAGPPSLEDDGSNSDSAGYRAPENRKWGRRVTAESDVYSFGVLLLELLTGKNPSLHPFLEVPEWVRAAREEEDAGDDGGQLRMLADVACICRSPSPEQRPAMWQVLKMIQEIKDSVGAH